MKWDAEETILLVDLYYKTENMSTNEKSLLIRNLSVFLKNRASRVNNNLSDTFRNVTGITMQLANIQFLVTDGERGLSSHSTIQRKIVDFFLNQRYEFNIKVNEILDNYNLDKDYSSRSEAKSIKYNQTNGNTYCKNFIEYLTIEKNRSNAMAERIDKLFQQLSIYVYKARKSKRKLVEITNEFEFAKISKIIICDKYIANSFKNYGKNEIKECLMHYLEYIRKNEMSMRINSENTKNLAESENVSFIQSNIKQETIFEKYEKYNIDYELNSKFKNDESTSQLIDILTINFKKGYKFNSLIDVKKFYYYYKEKYNSELNMSQEELNNVLKGKCIHYENERIMSLENVINQNTLNDILNYIECTFKDGKQAMYYVSLYNLFKERLLNTNVYNPKILKELLIYCLEQKYSFQRAYFRLIGSDNIDISSELENLLITNYESMQFEDIVVQLPHISESKLQQMLRGIEFVEVETNRYTHISKFCLSEEEISIIKTDIDTILKATKFVTFRKLLSVLHENRIEFLETHEFTNATCLKGVLTYYMQSYFEFKWNFIGKTGADMTISSLIKEFTDGKETFTLSELEELGQEIDVNITQGAYIEEIMKDYIRLDIDTFMKKQLIQFDVPAIDDTIDKFCTDGYTSIASIKGFSIFPSIGLVWNSFLIESYVKHFSKRYEIMSYSLSVKKSIGAIVEKKMRFLNYDEVLADLAIKNNSLNLQDEGCVIDYFFNNGYIAQRKLKTYIGNILAIAREKK